jgi:outer membrane receptor for ferrienterochelin and colicin
MGRIKLGLCLLALIVSFQAFAQKSNGVQISVAGTVVDSKSGEPIPGVAIRLDENYLWAVSDENGRFLFDNVQASTYRLEASCLGYVTVTMDLQVKADMDDLVIKMALNSLALKEVVVTAETSKDNINTTRDIGRNALDHLQLSNAANITSLLPGGKTINPDLTNDNVISLRSGGSSYGNAAFGTAVEVDGVRMGGNGNFGSMDGTGTRSISVENIESIEVLTGVPSAEYGDLGSGMVRIHTKKGRSPLNVVFSVNPRTYEASVSKGIDLGGNRGTLNLSGEYARSTSKLSSPYTSYTRRGFTIDYTKTFNGVLRLETGLSGNIGGMNDKDDPDSYSDQYTKARDNVLTPHAKLTWMINKPWITNLSVEGSIFYHDERTHDHVYNSTASSQPAVHATEEGYWLADQLPLTYYSDEIVDSKELDYSASAKYSWLRHFGKFKNTLKAGVQYNADGNVGDGEKYEDESLAANGWRPRPYSDYPYMHDLAEYIEDEVSFPVGKTSVKFSGGLRHENIFIKDTDYDNLSTFDPRFNLSWKLADWITIRGGWGITTKMPSFYILYPQQEYRDIQTFGFSYGSSGESSYVYYTQPYKTLYNKDLKWQSNHNSEIGIDATILNTKISLVGYYNITRNPYRFTNVYSPFSYNIMSLPSGYTVPDDPEIVVDHQNGYVYIRGSEDEYFTQTELLVTDRTFVTNKMQSNGDDVKRWGIELTADFPEIHPIRTSLRLDASWNYMRYVDNTDTYLYRTGWSHTTLANRSYQYVGIYPGSLNGSANVYNGRWTSNIDANITAITHIPEARLIVTVRLEAALTRDSRYISSYKGKTYAFTVGSGDNTPTGGDIYDGNSYTAIYPIAYMDLDGNVHPWTDDLASDPDFQRLILRSGNVYTFAKDGYDPYFSANISITKEIGDHVSLSFFANNFTNSRRYVKSWATGVSTIFTPDFYYGLTCRLKF